MPVEVRAHCAQPATARLACAEWDTQLQPLTTSAGDQLCFDASGHAATVAQGMRPSWRLLSGMGLDLNRASAHDLQHLPRIGPKLAARIVAHRRAHGPFICPEALKEVPGIGPKLWATLAPMVVVTPASGGAAAL